MMIWGQVPFLVFGMKTCRERFDLFTAVLLWDVRTLTVRCKQFKSHKVILHVKHLNLYTSNMLFSLWTCQGEAWQLNMQWWTNPCWSVRWGLLCQAGTNSRGLLLSQRFYCALTCWTNALWFGLSHHWSDLPILHHRPPGPQSTAVKWHAFIKCLLFQLLNSPVILLLDNNLRPPPSAASHS